MSSTIKTKHINKD